MKLYSLAVLGCLLGVAASAQIACAQQPPPPTAADLQKQLDAMRAQVGAMQKDLDEIKALLAPLRARQPTANPNAVLDLGARPVRGQPGAKVTLVELTDYQ